jgi:hypothetical protein
LSNRSNRHRRNSLNQSVNYHPISLPQTNFKNAHALKNPNDFTLFKITPKIRTGFLMTKTDSLKKWGIYFAGESGFPLNLITRSKAETSASEHLLHTQVLAMASTSSLLRLNGTPSSILSTWSLWHVKGFVPITRRLFHFPCRNHKNY